MVPADRRHGSPGKLRGAGNQAVLVGVADGLSAIARYLPAQPMIDAATRALESTGGGVHLMTGHDLAVLTGWTLGGLLVSMRFFAWDPHRPAHARHLGAGTPPRSA